MHTPKKRRMRTAATIGSALMLAPSVAMMRLPLMANGTGGSLDSETVRAVTEKTAALVEGALAAQVSLLKSALQFWPEVFSGRTPSLFNGVAAEQSMYAALKPVSRRVKVNFDRLSKKA